MKTPKLIPVDLMLGKGSHHPLITKNKLYLGKFYGEYHVGRFSRQWYGWNFDCGWGGSGMQLDRPGTNSSPWEGLWEIVE